MAGYLTELEYRRDNSSIYKNLLQSNEQIISNLELSNLNLQNKVELLENKIQLYDSMKPAFYDNFIFGFVAGSILYTALIILIK